MASTIDGQVATGDADTAFARRSTVVAAVAWVVVGGAAASAILSPDWRELSACVGLMASLVAYGFSTRAVFFAARVPQASAWVLFLEGMRRRVTDEPRFSSPRHAT